MSRVRYRLLFSKKAFTEWIDARVRAATLEAVSQSEQRTIYRVEVLSQLISAQFHKNMADFKHQNAHHIENRAQISAMDAKAYADSGLYTLSKSVAATNRVVAEASKWFSTLQSTAATLAKELKSLTSEVEETARQVHDVTLFCDAITSGEVGSGWLLDLKQSLSGMEENADRLVADYNAQLRNAEKRIEFVRTEILYELQASLMKASISKAMDGQRETNVNARIVNPDKVSSHRASGLRLNVGCGHVQPDGFVNVDSRDIPGIDVVAEAAGIPFANGEVAEIFTSHLVEHFPANILHRVLLPHWYNLLQSGGTLTTIAPDGAAMLDAVAKGAMSFEDYREVLFGAQDYDGDYHYNLLTPENFCKSLRLAGFVNAKIEYAGKKNGKCFEFKITARKI